MKSERRHELQTNYLADHLGTAVEGGKPFGVWIVGGIIGVALAALGYGIYTQFSQKADSQAWSQYYFQLANTDSEAFQAVIDDHPKSQAAAWASQNLADGQLLAGLDLIYTDRDQAEEKINSAIKSYEALIASTLDMELKDRATMGLAQAYEGLGKLDDAAKYYQLVAESKVLPAVATTASERLAWIRSPQAKEFYTWFSSTKPKPDAPPIIPSDLTQPPKSPDISLSPNVNVTLPQSTPPTTATPSDAAPLNLPQPTAQPDAAAPAPATPASEQTAPAPAQPGTTEPKVDAPAADAAPAAPPAAPAEAPPK